LIASLDYDQAKECRFVSLRISIHLARLNQRRSQSITPFLCCSCPCFARRDSHRAQSTHTHTQGETEERHKKPAGRQTTEQTSTPHHHHNSLATPRPTTATASHPYSGIINRPPVYYTWPIADSFGTTTSRACFTTARLHKTRLFLDQHSTNA